MLKPILDILHPIHLIEIKNEQMHESIEHVITIVERNSK